MITFIKNFFKKRPQLEDVLAYENDFVIQNFLKHYDVSDAEAREFFKETLKWLWLCGTTDQAVSMLSPMNIVDEMWHNFILCSKEYDAFCNRYFGKFIHHVPALSKTENEALDADEEGVLMVDEIWQNFAVHGFVQRAPSLKKTKPEMPKLNEDQLREMITLVYDLLGEETVVRWYSHYPEVYSIEKIKVLRRN